MPLFLIPGQQPWMSGQQVCKRHSVIKNGSNFAAFGQFHGCAEKILWETYSRYESLSH